MTLSIENGLIPQEVREVIRSGQCRVFLGSGPSLSSYHSWPDLVNALCNRCGITPHVTRDSLPDELLNAAQDAKSADRNAYYKFLGEHFGRSVDSAPLLYDVLLSLPFACYLTVNFDPMFALRARTARLPCSLPVRAYPSLDRLQMGNRSIHYLHGIIAEDATPTEGTIVLARSEFDEAYGSNSSLMNLLVPTLENDPILFIGCGLREPAMQHVFAICKKHQQNRLRVMAELGNPPSKPPSRFIFLSRPKVINASGALDAQQSQDKMSEQQTYYSNFDIEPVWYDAHGNNHSALRLALEQLAELPDVRPHHGW